MAKSEKALGKQGMEVAVFRRRAGEGNSLPQPGFRQKRGRRRGKPGAGQNDHCRVDGDGCDYSGTKYAPRPLTSRTCKILKQLPASVQRLSVQLPVPG